jgi:hypothetical protein
MQFKLTQQETLQISRPKFKSYILNASQRWSQKSLHPFDTDRNATQRMRLREISVLSGAE